MQTPRIFGIGELLWDRLPTGARLGGATTNFAVFNARLGNQASLISSVGNDHYGTAARESLVESGLDLSHLQVDTEHKTGTVEVTFSPEGQPAYVISTNVAWDFIRTNPGMEALAASAGAAYFGTLAQRHVVSRTAIRRFIGATPESCVRVCDINLRVPLCSSEVLAWSMARSTIIKISDEELHSAFSLLREVDLVVDEAVMPPHTAAEHLLEFFPQCSMVALTLGSKGCLLVTRTGSFEHPGFPITPIDPVGAGDAFTAGITHAYLRDAPLSVIATIGNQCGSFVASQHGATPRLPGWLEHQIYSLLGEIGSGEASGIRHSSHRSEAMRESS